MKTGTKFLLLLLAFLCTQGSDLQAQNQAQMKTAVSSALDAFLGAGQQTINTDGIGQNGDGQTVLQGKSTFFGTANVDYSAEFYTNSSSKIEKLIANFPAGSSITDPIFKTMLGKKLSDVIPQKFLSGIGVKQIIINFEGSNNTAKGLKLSLTGKQGLDLFNINGITLNKILELAGMNLKDVIFTVEADELGLTPTINVGLGADVDANGLDVQVRGNVSTSLADSEISIKVDNVTLDNVMSNLVGQSGFNTLPIPGSIKNAKLGNGTIKVQPLKLKLTAVANMTIQDQVVGSVDILVGKADPAKKNVPEEPKPEDLASQDAINKATAALEDNTKKTAGSGWTATKPSNQGGGSGMIVGDHRSTVQLQANIAGNAARAAIEDAKKKVEAANPQDNKSSAGGLDFHVGFSLNMDNVDLGQIHSSFEKLESWRKYIPSGVLAIVISSYKGEVDNPALVSLGETNVRKGLNIIAGFAMPSDVKNAIGLQAGVLKGMISTTSFYLEASLNSDLKFLVAKDQYISSTAPFALDPGFLGLANQNKHHVMASLRKVSIGIAPLGGFEMNIKGMMDVYLNGPGTQPLQFYLMGYYTPPGTVGFGVALMGEWNDPLKIYSQTVPGLDILKGLKVGDLAFQLGADFLTASGIPIPEVYVSGLLGFNGIQANGALGVDVNTPQNSMLEAGIQNLTAWKVAEAFTPQQGKALLNKIPSVVKKSLQTGLNNAELKIVPMNYTNTLTGITYEQGLGIGGDVDIAGWNANMVFRLNATGMTAKGALDPVNIKIKGQEIFKFTGKTNTQKGPEAAINLTVDNLISTTEPLILIDGKASFFGAVSTGALMKFDGDEFVLESDSKILNQFKGKFKLRGPGLKNLNDLHLEVKMEQDMMDALANEVGKISNALAEIVNASIDIESIHFEGNLGINNGATFDFTIKSSIGGKTIPAFTIPDIKIDPNLIQNLAEEIFNKTKDEFLKHFGKIVEFVINAAEDVYNTSVSFASDLGSDAGDFFISLAGAPSDIINKGISGLGSAFGIGGSSTNTIKPYRGPNTAPVAMITNKAHEKAINKQGTGLSSSSSKDYFWAFLPYKNDVEIFIYNVESGQYLTVEDGNIKTTTEPSNYGLWTYVKSSKHFRLQHKVTGKFLTSTGSSTALSETQNDAALWKGGATDYILPKDILAGKAKAIAEVYLDSKYKGSMAYLRNKSYSAKEYGSIFPSAELSSLKFYQTNKYTLTFKGNNDQIKLSKSMDDLSNLKFNDQALSVQVRTYNASSDKIIAELFDDGNYQGKRILIYSDMSSINNTELKKRIGNDNISAVKVTSGYEVTLYDDAGYKGGCRTFTSNAAELAGNGINFQNRASSVKVGKKGKTGCSNGVVKVFDDGNYAGNSYGFEEGNYNVNVLKQHGVHDNISSIKVSSGYKVILYDDKDFKGSSKTITKDCSELANAPYNFQNRTSSLKVIKLSASSSTPSDAVKPGRATFYITGKQSNKVIEVSDFSQANGGNVQQWEKTGTTSQQWEVESATKNNSNYQYYTLRNVNSGKYLDVEASSTSNSANVHQWSSTEANNQHWWFKDAGNGYVYIMSRVKPNFALDVADYSMQDGGNLVMYQSTNADNQKFKLSHVPKNTVTIYEKNNYEGKSMELTKGKTYDLGKIMQGLGVSNIYSMSAKVPNGWKMTVLLRNSNGSIFPYPVTGNDQSININGRGIINIKIE